jgi:hypothetical protein
MTRFAFALLVLLSAAPAVADDYLPFHAPSGNIQCMIATGDYAEARCDVMELASPIPARPADCDLDYGHAFGIGPQDMLGSRICAGDTVADPNGMVLQYGDHIDLGGFRCTSEKTGMTCTNAAGHGFTLSRRAQSLF